MVARTLVALLATLLPSLVAVNAGVMVSYLVPGSVPWTWAAHVFATAFVLTIAAWVWVVMRILRDDR